MNAIHAGELLKTDTYFAIKKGNEVGGGGALRECLRTTQLIFKG